MPRSLDPLFVDVRILLSRFLSMSHGRPSMITSRHSIVYTPLDATADQSVSPEIIYFQHDLALHNILGEILTEFYEMPPSQATEIDLGILDSDATLSVFHPSVFVRRISEGDFQSLLKFDTALLKWRSQVPELLASFDHERGSSSTRTQNSNQANSEVVKRQAAILYVRYSFPRTVTSVQCDCRRLMIHRYLYIRILLFRPLLLKVLADSRSQLSNEDRNDGKLSLHGTLMIHASTSCISDAQDLCNFLANKVEIGSALLPEWKYTILSESPHSNNFFDRRGERAN